MPAWVVPAILGGMSAIGGLLGGRKKVQEQTNKTTSSGSSTTQGNNTSFSSRSPIFDPAAWNMRNDLIGRALNRNPLVDPTTAARSMVTGGVQQINASSELMKKAIDNIMRQRGLQFSPAGAAMQANAEASRFSEVGKQFNQLPLLIRQFQNENEGIENTRQQLAQQMFSLIPYGTQDESFQNYWGKSDEQSTSESKGTMTDPGNMGGSALSSMLPLLAYFWSKGGLGPLPKQG